MQTTVFLIWSLIGAGLGLPVLCGSPVEPRTVVARVNDVPISSGELNAEIDRLVPSSVAAHGKAIDSSAIRKKALEELIVRELAYQEAKQHKMTVSPAEMNAAIVRIQGHYKTEASFRAALEAEQISREEFLRRVEKDLLLRKVYKRELDDQAFVTRGEVEAYYRANRAKFVVPESLRLFHVWVRGDDQAAKSKVEAAVAKLKSGTPFFDVAYQYSEDDYRVVGGDYGWVHRGQLAPELETLAFSAPTKTLIGPSHSSFGWHILRIEDHRAERQMALEEVRAKITEALERQRLAQRREEFTRHLRENARIEYMAP